MEELLLSDLFFFAFYLIAGTIISRTEWFKYFYNKLIFDVPKNEPEEKKNAVEFELRFLCLTLCLPQIIVIYIYGFIIKSIIKK